MQIWCECIADIFSQYLISNWTDVSIHSTTHTNSTTWPRRHTRRVRKSHLIRKVVVKVKIYPLKINSPCKIRKQVHKIFLYFAENLHISISLSATYNCKSDFRTKLYGSTPPSQNCLNSKASTCEQTYENRQVSMLAASPMYDFQTFTYLRI